MKKYVLLVVLILLPLMASAQRVEIDGIYYDLPRVLRNTKTVSVASNPNMYSGEITIPNSIIYENVEYKVTQIGDNAFGGCFELSSVTIPQSITTMGYSAFGGCHGLKVYITDIESWCKITFYNESSNPLNASGHLFLNGEEVHDLVIPDGIQNVNLFAFYGCKSLTSLKLSKSVISIGDYAFYDCKDLTDVFIKVGMIQEMGEHSFTSQENITLHVPAISVNNYQNAGFKAIVALDNSEVSGREIYLASAGSLPAFISEEEKYTIEELTLSGELNGTDIRLLRDMAGNNYKGEFTGGKLRSLDLSAAKIVAGGDFYLETNYITSNISFIYSQMSVQSNDEIPRGAFAGCLLRNIILPSGIKKIGDRAFGGCPFLESIFIPCNVQSISHYAFLNCQGLESIIVSSSNSKYASWENCNSIIYIDTRELIIGCRNSKIPNNVISIGEGAFANTNLHSFSIPGNVSRIKNGAFSQCELDKVSFSYGLTQIDDDAFSGCSGLTSIKIPSTVSYIAPTAFANCSSLVSVQVDQNSVYASPDNCNAIIEASTKTLILGCKKSTIPDGVTAIGKNAFLSCKGLISISIPSGVKSIGDNAFRNCSALSTITIPNSMESIGVNAFYGCSGLTDVYCKAEDVPITDASSYSNSNIGNASLQVPENSISNYKQATPWSSFKDISAIRTFNNVTIDGITYNLSTEGYIAEVIQGTETYTGEVVIPQKVFYEDHEFVTMCIGNDAFSSCNSLTSITIPNSVTSIGERAFSNCSNFKTIYCKAEIVPATDITIFDGVNLDNITLYVPGGHVDIYKSVEPWDKIGHIEENYVAIETPLTFEAIDGTVTVNIMNYYCSQRPVIQYSIDGGPWTDFTLSNTECYGTIMFSNKLPSGKIVQLRGNEWYGGFWESDHLEINCDDDCYVYGNVCSLDKGEDFAINNEEAGRYGFLFKDNTHIRNHPNKDLILPSTTLTERCYAGMFKGCTGLIRAPKLPATTLADECYTNMFMGCTNLTEAPELPATKLEKWCYVGMFFECPNLKYVKCLATENIVEGDGTGLSSAKGYFWPSDDDNGTVTSWLKDAGTNVSGTKTFIVNESLTITGVDPLTATVENWGERSVSGIPESWALGNLMGETTPITIGKSGKASYCGDKSLDFSYSDEVKAYIATGYDKDAEIIWLTRVMDVPAGVPVLIKGKANKTYDVPVTDSQNSYYTNMFVGNTSGEKMVIQETEGDMVNYYLSSDGTFKSVNKTANIGTNKCYLQLPGTFEATATGETQTVKVGSIGKASFAAPVDLDFTNVDGLKAFTATGYDKSSKTIWLTRVMKVQKGEGVLLKGDAKDYEIPSAAVQSSYMNMFVGNTSGDKIQVQEKSEDGSQTNFYLNSDGAFVSVNGFVNIGNNKCYLELPTDMVAGAASTRGAEANYILEEPEIIKLPISFRSLDNDGNGTTAIRETKQSREDGAYYTLQGQRVLNPGKGLYIKNGRKVVIK